MPTWSEFLTIASAQGVRRRTSQLSLIDPQGRTLPVRYLERAGLPPVIHPQLDPSDRLQPALLGHLCRRLRIDPAPFGLSLDDLPPESWL